MEWYNCSGNFIGQWQTKTDTGFAYSQLYSVDSRILDHTAKRGEVDSLEIDCYDTNNNVIVRIHISRIYNRNVDTDELNSRASFQYFQNVNHKPHYGINGKLMYNPKKKVFRWESVGYKAWCKIDLWFRWRKSSNRLKQNVDGKSHLLSV